MTLDIAQLAARQLRDYDARTPGAIFAEGLSLSEQQAYAIQSETSRLRQRSGEALIGYKIGCTSPVVQRQLGTDHPIFGRVFSSERYCSGTEQLLLNQFAGLAIEGELAVRLSENIPGDCTDPDRILRCVSGVFPVIELHNLVLRSQKRDAAELIANNALHAGFVALSVEHDLPSCEELLLRISVNGEATAEANGDWRTCERHVG